MNLVLERSYHLANSPQWVVGRLKVGCYEFKTIERPWLHNKKNISCIPEGVYILAPFNGQRFKDSYQVLNVPGRTYILIHPGNRSNDVRGCIAIGRSLEADHKGSPFVTDSKKSMGELRQLLGKRNHTITIKTYKPEGCDCEVFNGH